MPIVGGLDIHRKQLTFDYLDTVTGQVARGQVTPADREHLRAWLARFAGRDDVAFAVEGCTGWRYVAGELAAAGISAHVAEPADTAFARGHKRHAKTDRTDSRHLRQLLAEGRLPQCWIPPPQVLECRALLETYHDLRREHTAWVQRIHAVSFHHGAPRLGESALRAAQGLAAVRAASAAHLSPAGQVQVATALDMLTCLEGRLDMLRHQLLNAARHIRGANVLAARLYGVGPVTALAITCWLGGAGRFSSSRKAVRFAGLDITVYSSDGKRSPGQLSRQGPPVLRWAAYEAGKVHARTAAPDHGYYAAVADRKNTKRAALSEARKDHPAGLPHPGRARRRRAHRRLNQAPLAIVTSPVACPSPDKDRRSRTAPMGTAAAGSRQAAVSPPRPSAKDPGRRPDQTERPHPRTRGHPINHHVSGAPPAPRGPR